MASIETPTKGRKPKILYTHDGKTLSVPQWARLLGVKESTLRARFDAGMEPERALTRIVPPALPFNGKSREPRVYPAKLYPHRGEMRTLRDWAEILGLDLGTIRARVHKGEKGDDIFKPTVRSLLSPEELSPQRCFVCSAMFSAKEMARQAYTEHGRFKKAHAHCFKGWLKVQSELTGKRKYVPDWQSDTQGR